MSGVRLRVRLSLIATTAVAAAAVGCGGSDETSTMDADGDALTSESAQECLTNAGLNVTAEAPTSEHMVGNVLYVNVDQPNQVYVAFIDGPQQATKIEEGLDGLATQAGGNAGAELVGDDIVLARANATTAADVSQVKSCLTG